MILIRALQAYWNNRVTLGIFVLLGILVVLLGLLSSFFLATANVWVFYAVGSISAIEWVSGILLVIVAMAFFATFEAAMILAVRQDLAQVKFGQYVREKLPRFALELFEFWVLFVMMQLLIAALLLGASVSGAFIAFILLVLNVLVFFVPQSVVIDELSWVRALEFNWVFLMQNKLATLGVLVVGVLLVGGVLPAIEWVFDSVSDSGRFVALAVALVFVVPFLESLKTVVFMRKFDLVKDAQ